MSATVQDLLCTDILKITPDVSIEFAVSLALYRNQQILFVVDRQQQLLGIVPEYSLIKSILCDTTQCDVEQIVSSNIVSRDIATPLESIVPLFREAAHEAVAITSAGKLVGQLRRCDVMHWLAGGLARPNERDTTDHQTVLPEPNFLKNRQTNPQSIEEIA